MAPTAMDSQDSTHFVVRQSFQLSQLYPCEEHIQLLNEFKVIQTRGACSSHVEIESGGQAECLASTPTSGITKPLMRTFRNPSPGFGP